MLRGDEVGYGKGSVVGWLPAEQSDFVDERTNRPAALWHVEYVEVCENLCRCPPADMGADSAGPKNIAVFLHALAVHAPLMLVANLGFDKLWLFCRSFSACGRGTHT